MAMAGLKSTNTSVLYLLEMHIARIVHVKSGRLAIVRTKTKVPVEISSKNKSRNTFQLEIWFSQLSRFLCPCITHLVF